MKLTLLSKGDGFHFPPCYMLDLCGFQILLECPIDLSALKVFSPIPASSCQLLDVEVSESLAKESSCADHRQPKRQKVEKPLEVKDLICTEPWFKTVTNLHLWDLSFIDIVVISSPMGMLGLPFLTRNKNFSAKIYATEATVRIGKLMMEDLVSMHMEFRQFYGPEESGLPKWMKWDELELLPITLKEILMGEDGAALGSWHSLYSIADVKDCLQKCTTLKYAEEACYNDTLILQALSSGLEIGASNWTIRGPRRSVTYLSSSIFKSAHAMNCELYSLRGNDVILFSDFSSLNGMVGVSDDTSVKGISQDKQTTGADGSAAPRVEFENEENFINTDDSFSEETNKIAFICSCAIDSVKQGGSVLIPFGRIGVVLQLLEQISIYLESANLEVPIYMISSVAEEMLAYTNILPEWLCRERQENLYRGDALFGHVELIKNKKLHLFPAIHSIDLLMMWQEPCIVFAPHWSLRLGPVVHLLQRWSGDPNSLLVLEQEVDADLALLPFKPVLLKVLQCSFLSGIKIQKIQPLLEILRPKLVLLPEEFRSKLIASGTSSYSVLHYSDTETLRIPSFNKDFEVNLATDLAFQLRPVMMKQENLAMARLKGKLIIDHGKFFLKDPVESLKRQTPVQKKALDADIVLRALQKIGVCGSLEPGTIHIDEPSKALIEMHDSHTVISAADEILASRLFQTVSCVLSES